MAAPPSPAYSLEEILQAMLRHHRPKPASLCLNQTKSHRVFSTSPSIWSEQKGGPDGFEIHPSFPG